MHDEQRIINLILESIYEMSEADKPKKGQSGLSRAFKRSKASHMSPTRNIG
jgi:hypothetical protein